MTSVIRGRIAGNVLANYLGQGWAALMAIAFSALLVSRDRVRTADAGRGVGGGPEARHARQGGACDGVRGGRAASAESANDLSRQIRQLPPGARRLDGFIHGAPAVLRGRLRQRQSSRGVYFPVRRNGYGRLHRAHLGE